MLHNEIRFTLAKACSTWAQYRHPVMKLLLEHFTASGRMSCVHALEARKGHLAVGAYSSSYA
jgi:hypothetical protein